MAAPAAIPTATGARDVRRTATARTVAQPSEIAPWATARRRPGALRSGVGREQEVPGRPGGGQRVPTGEQGVAWTEPPTARRRLRRRRGRGGRRRAVYVSRPYGYQSATLSALSHQLTPVRKASHCTSSFYSAYLRRP